jgi:hypothetical protein
MPIKNALKIIPVSKETLLFEKTYTKKSNNLKKVKKIKLKNVTLTNF